MGQGFRLPKLRDVFGNIRLVHGLGRFNLRFGMGGLNLGFNLRNMNLSMLTTGRPKAARAVVQKPLAPAAAGSRGRDPVVERMAHLEAVARFAGGMRGGRRPGPRLVLPNPKQAEMTTLDKRRAEFEAGRRMRGHGQSSSPTTTVETGRGTTPGAVPRGDTLGENIYVQGSGVLDDKARKKPKP